MIGEYDNSGNIINEYVYFGLRPVAVKAENNLNIVHSDYLGTPRVVTSGGSIVWQWKNDNPYGSNKAQGTLEFNLRFAGQYYDSESELHYNIHRTYNPEVGRYMQSDPIGLAGGNNNYNYVNRNPLDSVDPLGLVEYSGTIDPKFKDVQVGGFDKWTVLKMHASYNLLDSGGGLSLEYGSDLYEQLKNTSTFKLQISNMGEFEKQDYGNIVRNGVTGILKYGVSGRTMGKMLLEAGLVNKDTEGILVQACNFGSSTSGGDYNGQSMSNITNKKVKIPTDNIYVNNNKIVGSLGPKMAFAYSRMGFDGGFYARIFGNMNENALNVMRTFVPLK